jgi:hypothetical protein
VNLFPFRYVYLLDKERSKDYLTAGKAAKQGLRAVARPLGLRYRIRPEGSADVSAPRDYEGTVKRLRELLRKNLGQTIRVIVEDPVGSAHVGTVAFRAHRSLPPMSDVQGTFQTRFWQGYVERAYPRARFAGTIACKGGSDHPYGGAADNFPPNDDIDQGKQMHEDAIENEDVFGTAYSIWWDEIWYAGPPWTNHTRGRYYYPGTLHRHHHASFREKRCGVWCTPGYGDCG